MCHVLLTHLSIRAPLGESARGGFFYQEAYDIWLLPTSDGNMTGSVNLLGLQNSNFLSRLY